MLTVHHLRLSQSERIVWLCEELELDYELKLYNRREDNRLAPDDYKALSPMGIAPVITDGDLTLGESGAIIEYIAGRHGNWKFCPKADDTNFAQHLFWFHFANGTFMTNVMMELAAFHSGAEKLPPFVQGRKDKAWDIVEDQLGKTEWLGGHEFTTADIMMGFPLTTMRAMGNVAIDNRPNILAYLKRVGERPAYQRAMAKCEPGMPPKLD